jgi:thiol-disulfide isomerase/thioredoxin
VRTRHIFALSFGLFAGALLLAGARSGAGEKKAENSPPAAKGLRVEGKLTEDDPRDKIHKRSYAKTYPFEMKAGRGYKIEMISKEDDPAAVDPRNNPAKLDPFLRLEGPDGRNVAFDDDGAGYPNARILHQAEKDGTYKIIATTFAKDQTGQFLLTATETKLTPMQILVSRVRALDGASPEVQKKVLDDVARHLKERKKDISKQDAFLAVLTANALRETESKLTVQAHEDLGKILAGAADEQVAEVAKAFAGTVRRLRLPGNQIEVKGKLLDGKDIDWKSYRGKVVLVDFWATWCGPCVEELPNVRKLYDKYHDRGFDVVGVSLDQKRDALERFVKREKLPWVCIAPEGGQELAEYYNVEAIPLPILVDRQGRVISMEARGEELERLLEKHLGAAEKDKK